MSKAERTRQFILKKAAPLFMINGVAGTAMSDIMEVTKLAKGSLYLHFENKEQLYYAVVDYNLESLGNKMIGALKKAETEKNKILSILDLMSRPLNPPVDGGCPMLNFGIESDDTNPVIKEKINNFINFCCQQLSGFIVSGIAKGEFDSQWNAKDFALKMFVMIEGAILVSKVAGNDSAMKDIVRMLQYEIEQNSI